MADTKISDESSAGTLTGAEIVPVVRPSGSPPSYTNLRTTTQDIADLVGLGDVNITSPTTKSWLHYNGLQWIDDDVAYFSSGLIQSANNSNGTTFAVDNYVDSQNPVTAFPIFATRQYGGTIASPSAILNGTVLGVYSFYGYDGTAIVNGASVQAIATENWSATNRGTKLRFASTPNGSTTPVFSLELAQDGSFTINGANAITLNDLPYSVAFSAPQTTAFSASQVIGHHRMAANITITANFGNFGGLASQAGGTANATGSTVFSVEKAATATPNTFSQIGTITFAAGTVTPTFATASGAAQNLSAGDVLRIVAPSSPDATFAGFYCTLIAKRQ